MYATTYVAMEEMRLKLIVRMIMIFSRSVNCQQDFGLRRNRSIAFCTTCSEMLANVI
jgi:hypothetical protein